MNNILYSDDFAMLKSLETRKYGTMEDNARSIRLIWCFIMWTINHLCLQQKPKRKVFDRLIYSLASVSSEVIVNFVI